MNCPTCQQTMRCEVGLWDCPQCGTLFVPQTPRGPRTLTLDALDLEALAKTFKIQHKKETTPMLDEISEIPLPAPAQPQHTYTWETCRILNCLDIMEHAEKERKAAPLATPPAQPTASLGAEPEFFKAQPAVQLLIFLDRYQRAHGQMPSYTEIAKQHLNSDNSGLAHYCVSALEKADLVIKEPHVARGLRITAAGREVLANCAGIQEEG